MAISGTKHGCDRVTLLSPLLLLLMLLVFLLLLMLLLLLQVCWMTSGATKLGCGRGGQRWKQGGV
jgi:hypothetical protein